jgi:hypothetical protein
MSQSNRFLVAAFSDISASILREIARCEAFFYDRFCDTAALA